MGNQEIVGSKFKIGDRVIVRQWEDMKKEFGLLHSGSINVLFGFTKKMRAVCGKSATILGYDGVHCGLRRQHASLLLGDWGESVNPDDVYSGWWFSDGMLELATTEEPSSFLTS